MISIFVRAVAVIEQRDFEIKAFLANENIVSCERDGDMLGAVAGFESRGSEEFQTVNFESLHGMLWVMRCARCGIVRQVVCGR